MAADNVNEDTDRSESPRSRRRTITGGKRTELYKKSVSSWWSASESSWSGGWWSYLDCSVTVRAK